MMTKYSRLDHTLRSWFANGCRFYFGLEILKHIGVEQKVLDQLELYEGNPPSEVIELMKTTFYEVDKLMTFTGNFEVGKFAEKVTVEFKKLDLLPIPEQQEKTVADRSNLIVISTSPAPPVEQNLPTPPPVTTPVPKEEPPAPPPKELEPVQKIEPPSIVALRKKAIPIHKKYADLKGQLRAVDSEKKRYHIAREIMEEIVPKLDSIYKKIREWQNNGVIPTFPQTDGFSEGVKTMKRKESVRTRIAKLKRLMESEKDPKKHQLYKKELVGKELELLQIQQILDSV